MAKKAMLFHIGIGWVKSHIGISVPQPTTPALSISACMTVFIYLAVMLFTWEVLYIVYLSKQEESESGQVH
jgi:hypothetical protein